MRVFYLAWQANRPLVLLVLLALGMVSATPDLLHAHRSAGLGLYNAECPFAEIASRGGQESLPLAPPPVWTAWMVGVVATGVATILGARLPLHSGSRAPPFV